VLGEIVVFLSVVFFWFLFSFFMVVVPCVWARGGGILVLGKIFEILKELK